MLHCSPYFIVNTHVICLSDSQEGHTAHASPEEAEEMAMRMVRIYEKFAVEVRFFFLL